MRKVLAIWLLLIFSITQTELGQLLKIPSLVEHFHTHRQQNSTLSFIDFLKDHYTKSHQDKDQSEDRKLPFQSSQFQSSSIAIVPFTIILSTLVKSIINKFYLFNDQYVLPQLYYPIFHPPSIHRLFFTRS